MVEFLEGGKGDCGCPEEHYLFYGMDLHVHFEPNGDVDGFLDGGDWGEATTTVFGADAAEGRKAIFDWAAEKLGI